MPTPSPVDGGSSQWMDGATTCSISVRRLTLPSKVLPAARSPFAVKGFLDVRYGSRDVPLAPSSLGSGFNDADENAEVDGQQSGNDDLPHWSQLHTSRPQASSPNANDFFNTLL